MIPETVFVGETIGIKMSLAHLPSYALVSFDATPIILVTEIPEKPGRDPDSKPRTYKLELQRIHQHVYKANYAPAKPGRVILQVHYLSDSKTLILASWQGTLFPEMT